MLKHGRLNEVEELVGGRATLRERLMHQRLLQIRRDWSATRFLGERLQIICHQVDGAVTESPKVIRRHVHRGRLFRFDAAHARLVHYSVKRPSHQELTCCFLISAGALRSIPARTSRPRPRSAATWSSAPALASCTARPSSPKVGASRSAPAASSWRML